MIRRLQSHAVTRPWGRRSLPDGFPTPDPAGDPIGEIWFEDAHSADSALLVKYLFTSERLSIQVHPGDAAGRAAGHRSGKDEAWLVVDADPGAVIGLGLTHEVTTDQLREAALDGSIERLIDWRPVRPGDFFYSPAGTIHAIGGGVALIEIQQASDVTYRLYDYGRPRELHLEAGLAVADAGPYRGGQEPVDVGGGRRILAAGGAFVVERWRAEGSVSIGGEDELIVIPTGDSILDGATAEKGSVWSVEGEARFAGEALLAYAGAQVREMNSA